LRAEARRELQAWETFGAQIKLTRRFNVEAAALDKPGDGPAVKDKNLDELFRIP